MPAQKSKGGFLEKYGDKLRKAHEESRAEPPDYGSFSDLPDGIEGGIAQLIDIKIEEIPKGKDNAGEYRFAATGIAKYPQALPDGRRVAGGRTQVFEPLFDTPTRTRKTPGEHWKFVLNQLKLLGLETTEMSMEEVEENLRALKEAAPYFKFRTWKGSKQTEGQYKDRDPRTQHQWMGIVLDFDEENPESGAGLDDHTAGNGEPVDEFAGETPSEEEPTEDLDALAEGAAADDNEAVTRLTELGKAAGMKQKEIDNADSWQDVVAKIREHTGAAGPEEGEEEGDEEEEGEEGGEEEEAAAKPQVRDPVRYRPLDPKTKRPQKKAIECQVTVVNEAKKTVDLKSLDNPKTVFKSVSWDALEY
jgi:hypothetical protein